MTTVEGGLAGRVPVARQTVPSPKLDPDRAVQMLRDMVRVRRFEERCAQLYSAGKIRGFLHLYIGEEAVAAGVLPALTAEDAVVATYREHGQAILRGLSMRSVMAEMFGKVEGCSGGRGGSMHLFDAERRFYGGNGIVAAGIPMALGLALADGMLGRTRITACFFGDGAVAEGEFYETANLAALWRLPLLMVCENNLYAMGTALWRSQAQTSLSMKAAVHNIPAWRVDGMDALAMADAADRAVAFVRGGGGPVFLEAMTFRFRAHSMYDPDRYRAKDEIEQWRQRDPIPALQERLVAEGLITAEEVAASEAAAEAEIDDAVAFADAGHAEPVETLTRWVYSEREP